jgi:hypothetical protein
VSRNKGARRWGMLVGYLFMVIGAFCLFFRYVYPGASDGAEWAETAWGLLVFGVGFFMVGGLLILAIEGWSRMVAGKSEQSRRTNSP